MQSATMETGKLSGLVLQKLLLLRVALQIQNGVRQLLLQVLKQVKRAQEEQRCMQSATMETGKLSGLVLQKLLLLRVALQIQNGVRQLLLQVLKQVKRAQEEQRCMQSATMETGKLSGLVLQKLLLLRVALQIQNGVRQLLLQVLKQVKRAQEEQRCMQSATMEAGKLSGLVL
jgi:hypothetical protein